jgi:UDP-N-acetyl-D-mannosaminuronic acid dehydrogenase
MAVTGIDTQESVVKAVNKGTLHITEPDLSGLLSQVVQKKSLTAQSTTKKADTFIIAVPTPFKENKVPDLSFVLTAISMITPHLTKDNLVIIESTCPVGTSQEAYKNILNQRPDLKGHIHIAYCPERVLPGRILYELEHNDRVIGGLTKVATDKAIQFYEKFVKGNLFPTNAKTAEMCKLIENAYRDTNIAFANELSMVCKAENIAANDVITLANKHPRVNILNPGPGVGGHCLAVDPWFLIHKQPKLTKLIHTARTVNLEKTKWLTQEIYQEIDSLNKKDPRIACFGITYKADIDDIRQSPALQIVQMLSKKYKNILTVDPFADPVQGIHLVTSEEALASADVCIFLVAHKPFKGLIQNNTLKKKLVLDYVNLKLVP